MPRPPSKILPLLLLVLGTSAGCDSAFAPRSDTVLEDEAIEILAVASNAPPLQQSTVSFWAVRGQDREVEIRYALPGGYSGKCLRFVVPAGALLRDADGQVIAPGDSILIDIRVVDPGLFLFEFDPGGVRFDPAHPARLEIRYQWAAALGRSGVDEDALVRQLSVWRQENPGESWVKIPSDRLEDRREVHAEITGFTRYALASDRHAVNPTEGQ